MPDTSQQQAILEAGTFAGFQVERKLGESADTRVYRAVRDGDLYTLKLFFSPDQNATKKAEDAFHREASYYSAFDSDVIPSCYDVGTERGYPYLVLDYLDGVPLDQLISQDGPLSPDSVRWIGSRLADAMSLFHDWGFIHGDIKPANIIVSDQHLHVIDLKLITELESSPRTARQRGDKITGTLGYVAPEQTPMFDELPSSYSDLYSLGVVLFEALTGRHPYAGSNSLEVFLGQIDVPPPKPSEFRENISPALSDFVQSLLHPDPSARYQNAERVKEHLSQLNQLDEMDESSDRADRGISTDTLSQIWQSPKPLVGRDEKLQRLWRAWTETLDTSELRLTIIEGPPGSGKSRLVQELGKQIQRREGIAIRATGNLSGDMPYGGLKETIQEHLTGEGDMLRIQDASRDQFIKALQPHQDILASFFPDSSDSEKSRDGSRRREAHDEALTDFLSALANIWGGVMLWFDDLQWLDEDSLRLLEYLAENTIDAPIHVICTSRHTSDSAKERIRRLESNFGEKTESRLQLDHLDRDEVEQLVRMEVSDSIVEQYPRLTEELTEKGEGAPLFVWHVLRTLRDKGIIVPDSGQLELNEERLDALDIPSGVPELMSLRIDHLSPSSREILKRAALLGDTFDYELLKRSLDEWSPSQLEVAMSEATGAMLVHRTPSKDHFRFNHDEIQESLLNEFTSEAKRRNAHNSFAKTLDENASDLNAEQRFARAYHFLHGDTEQNLERIRTVVLDAADAAEGAFAYERAYEILTNGREILGFQTDVQEHAYMRRLGRAAFETMRVSEARECYKHALELADKPLTEAEIEREIVRTEIYDYNFGEAARHIDGALAKLGASTPSNDWDSNFVIVPLLVWHWAVARIQTIFSTPDSTNTAPSDKKRRYELAQDLLRIRVGPAYIIGDRLELLEALVMTYRFGLKVGLNRTVGLGLCAYQGVCAAISKSEPSVHLQERAVEYFEQTESDAEQTRAFAQLLAPMLTALVSGRFRRYIELYKTHRDNIKYFLPLYRHYFHSVYLHMQSMRGYVASGERVGRQGIKTFEPDDDTTAAVIHTCYVGRTMQCQALLGNFEKAEKLWHKLQKGQAQLPDAIPHRRAQQIVGMHFTYLRQTQKLGDTFEDYAAEFDTSADRVQAGDGIFFTSYGYGRLDQARYRKSDTAINRLSNTVDILKDVCDALNTSPVFQSHFLVILGGYEDLTGNSRTARETLKRAIEIARECDNPWAAFEAYRQLGFSYLGIDSSEQLEDALTSAAEIARDMGWQHWPERLEDEFEISLPPRSS
jgi:serine/threonine protein kinase